jgi:hypothetical protein
LDVVDFKCAPNFGEAQPYQENSIAISLLQVFGPVRRMRGLVNHSSMAVRSILHGEIAEDVLLAGKHSKK